MVANMKSGSDMKECSFNFELPLAMAMCKIFPSVISGCDYDLINPSLGWIILTHYLEFSKQFAKLV